jgi:hypothetical protein
MVVFLKCSSAKLDWPLDEIDGGAAQIVALPSDPR